MILAFLSPALAWLRKVNPLVFVIAALAFAAWLGWHRAGHWRDEAARRSQVIATMQATSKAEQARATAEHATAAQREKELNDAADRRVELARDSDRAALDRYVRRLRSATGGSVGAQVPAAGQADLAQGGDPARPQSIMDVLASDLDICTENTRRLIEIHSEAIEN